jgi:transposase InsO family protein
MPVVRRQRGRRPRTNGLRHRSRIRAITFTIKTELLHRQPWPTHTAARQAIFECIEGWYNTRRRHSSLDYLSPAAFEATGREPLPEGQAA